MAKRKVKDTVKADAFEIPDSLKRIAPPTGKAALEKALQPGKVLPMPTKKMREAVKPIRKNAARVIKLTDKAPKARPGSKREFLLQAVRRFEGKTVQEYFEYTKGFCGEVEGKPLKTPAQGSTIKRFLEQGVIELVDAS